MTYAFPPDVEQLVAGRMAAGGYATEDDVLRDALRALAEEEEDLAAVREAIAECRAGDPGLPLDEAFDLVRRSARGTSVKVCAAAEVTAATIASVPSSQSSKTGRLFDPCPSV